MNSNNINDTFSVIAKSISGQLRKIDNGLELARRCRALQVPVVKEQEKVLHVFLKAGYRSFRKLKDDAAAWPHILRTVEDKSEHKPRKLETESDKLIMLFRFIFEETHRYDRALKFGRAASACTVAKMSTDDFGEALNKYGIEDLIHNAAIAVPRSKQNKPAIAQAEKVFADKVQEEGGYDAAITQLRQEIEDGTDDEGNEAKAAAREVAASRRDKKTTLHIIMDTAEDLADVTNMSPGQECNMRVRAEGRNSDGWMVLRGIKTVFH